jgi:alginate O-acetyltransferase complex protein AlgI
MLFNSLEFIVFFPSVFLLYWFVFSKNLKLQNLLLLISSYIFYGWWDWRFLSLIIFSSFVDYFIGQELGKESNLRKRRILLIISIIANIGILSVFKYYNFFIENFVHLLSQFSIHTNSYSLKIILPVGISFYTFQTMSYTIDIYKNKMKPTNDLLSFFTFVAFFPQLVAGPIERAKNLLPQFHNPKVFNYQLASSGSKLIVIGLFKKVVIADSLSILVDTVYNSPQDYLGLPSLVATIFFAFQIYCDFSGYSDIAIGLSRLLGIRLMKNFDSPYFSHSLTEFWKRWHISLSSWFRDYLYIPLGGNRSTNLRSALNLITTFLVSGLWHGANWTFIVWGAIHGVMLMIEKYSNKVLEKYFRVSFEINSIFKILFTFTIVCFAWIFFRSASVSEAIFIISNIFADIRDYSSIALVEIKFRGMGLQYSDIGASIIFILVLLTIEYYQTRKDLIPKYLKYPLFKWLYYYTLLYFIIFWGTRNPAENFIYFQF